MNKSAMARKTTNGFEGRSCQGSRIGSVTIPLAHWPHTLHRSIGSTNQPITGRPWEGWVTDLPAITPMGGWVNRDLHNDQARVVYPWKLTDACARLWSKPTRPGLLVKIWP